jgi:hypothetical protein
MMSISRRDFMKLVGISFSSLLLTNCTIPIGMSCYAPLIPTPTPNDPKSRLRRYWLSFGKLAARTQEESANGSTENTFGQELYSGHRATLDELVSTGELTAVVADLIQEAYGAAVNHVWRSNALITCYEPMRVDYAPASAQLLVQQSDELSLLAAQGNIDPQTLENARLAIEHDLAFYEMTTEEVNALYERLLAFSDEQGKSLPSFSEVELEISPEAKAATQFIINLLLAR